ncbi:MAG: hypothetical protein M3O02_13805 [Acidobacteriota bacterium]|nr:hypothetical protein [Acidobacteriota bacterium]
MRRGFGASGFGFGCGFGLRCAALLVGSAIGSFAQPRLTPAHHDAARQAPGTIVVPAADFFSDLPSGDSNDGRLPQGLWFFNNSTLNLGVRDELAVQVEVPEAGTYHLYVRSVGSRASGFRVRVNGQLDAATFGNGPLTLKRGGDFALARGRVEIRLTGIVPRPSLNVLVLSRSASLTDADLKPLELPAEVKLLHEYTIAPSNIVKFGDVDGSGRYAILDITSDYSAILYGNDGHELWRYQAPAEGARLRGEFEAPGLLWDFHGTGRDEVAHWRSIDGKEWLVLADGRTGEVIRKAPWPAPPLPHVYNNYRMAVAKFHKESPAADTLLVLSDTGGLISLTAYDKDLNQVWQHAEPRQKDYFGHYIYPYDVNGDGVDEVVISHLCLDAQGHEVWNNSRYFQKNNDHMDAMEFFDVTGDGRAELLVGQSDVGTLAYDAATGEMLWQNVSDHTQQITAGYILAGAKTPQVVANGRTYLPRPASAPGRAGGAGAGPVAAATASAAARNGMPTAESAAGPPMADASEIPAGGGGLGAQLYWFDNAGRLLERWPAHPLSGNPNFVRGDWYGTGKRTFFWFRFKLEPDGGATLFFKGEAYHMFDFDHTGADQVITLESSAGGANGAGVQRLRVYGEASFVPHPKPCDGDCRKRIANHTHY